MRWVKKPIAAQMKRAQTNMTYVVDGNKCANEVPQGQYFQLINSTIAGRSDGIYTASKAIPANYTIDNTYFSQTTPIAEGAINKIDSKLTALNSNFTNVLTALNIESVTRETATVTTGNTGNIALEQMNDGYTYIVGALVSGTDAFLRTWVSSINNKWYLTAVNPSSGASLNNTQLAIRYLVVKIKRI